jgi:exopolysaccharide biosynthesis polyprenyl glycosylphosphotransferase
VLAAWILAIIYVIFARILIRWFQRYLFKYGVGVHRVVLVGDSKTADNLMREFSKNKRLGFEVVKRLRDFSIESAKDLSDAIESFNGKKERYVDEIIQSDPNLKKGETLRLYDFADEYHVVFKYAADLLSTKVLRTEVAEISGVPIVEVKKTSLEGWGRIIKRILDILVSGFLIIILSPLLIIVALIVKIDSKGPIIYKNERVSRDGIFQVYKYRSMLLQYCTGEVYDDSGKALEYERKLIQKNNTKSEGPLYKIGNDPRITRVGKFIRRWSIDELPQLFNVFWGNMSMVGPRPHQPREVAKYEHHHKKLLGIKPGITGLAQISGRSDLSFEEEVKLETYYIENWSILLDFSIIIRTPLAVVKPRKAE